MKRKAIKNLSKYYIYFKGLFGNNSIATTVGIIGISPISLSCVKKKPLLSQIWRAMHEKTGNYMYIHVSNAINTVEILDFIF